MPEQGPVRVDARDRLLGRDAEKQAAAGHNPPEWVANEAIWEKAKRAAEGSPADERFAVITHIYKQMGGRIK